MDPFSAVTPGNRWSPGHGAVPRPPGCWIWASEQSCLIGLYCSRLFWKLLQLPRSTPPPRHSVSVSWGPAEARWGRTLAGVCAGRASPRDRRPTFRVLSLLGTAPETVWGESGNPVVPRLGKGHHPLLRKASQASQERCAVNDLGKKTQRLLSPSVPRAVGVK